MKIIVQIGNLSRYQPVKYSKLQNQLNLQQNQFTNLLNPDIKIFCCQCEQIISDEISILTTETNQGLHVYKDRCVKCFCSNLKHCIEIKGKYFVRIPNVYSLTHQNWRVSDDFLLLKAILKIGFGNWDRICTYMQVHGCLFSKQQVQEHFLSFLYSINEYKNSHFRRLRKWVPLKSYVKNHSSNYYFQEMKEKKGNEDSKSSSSHLNQTEAQQEHMMKAQRSQDSDNLRFQTSGQLQYTSQSLNIYTGQRDQFLIEYDPYAESLIANLEFTQFDTPEDIIFKQKLLISYNQKLRQRKKLKKFVLERNLLSLQPLNSQKLEGKQKQTFFLDKFTQNETLNKIVASFNRLFFDNQEIQFVKKISNRCDNTQTLKNLLRSLHARNPKIKSIVEVKQTLITQIKMLNEQKIKDQNTSKVEIFSEKEEGIGKDQKIKWIQRKKHFKDNLPHQIRDKLSFIEQKLKNQHYSENKYNFKTISYDKNKI